MSSASPLLIVTFDAEEAAVLGSIANSLGYPDAQIITGGISDAISALNSRSAAPNYLVMDIAESGSEIFPDLEALALHCPVGTVVIIVGLVNDINFYRELKERGVEEYFQRPVQLSDLRNVLLRTSVKKEYTSSLNRNGTVISLVSAASGDGASTVAVNLAYCLSEQLGQPTILVDMDYQFGWIAKSLDLTAPFGIRELFDYQERGVDWLLVEKMQVRYANNLFIISSPHELKQLPIVHPEIIRDLIALLRTKFKFVVLDVPHHWAPWTAAALSYSDHIVMVAQLWLRSLTHASRLLAAWQSIGIANNSVSLVINRSGAKFKEAIAAQDFERICQMKIEAYLSNDIKTAVGAETLGKTIFEAGKDSLLKQQIYSFAKEIASKTGSLSSNNSTLDRLPASSPKNLLSFLGKK